MFMRKTYDELTGEIAEVDRLIKSIDHQIKNDPRLKFDQAEMAEVKKLRDKLGMRKLGLSARRSNLHRLAGGV